MIRKNLQIIAAYAGTTALTLIVRGMLIDNNVNQPLNAAQRVTLDVEHVGNFISNSSGRNAAPKLDIADLEIKAIEIEKNIITRILQNITTNPRLALTLLHENERNLSDTQIAELIDAIVNPSLEQNVKTLAELYQPGWDPIFKNKLEEKCGVWLKNDYETAARFLNEQSNLFTDTAVMRILASSSSGLSLAQKMFSRLPPNPDKAEWAETLAVKISKFESRAAAEKWADSLNGELKVAARNGIR